MSGDFPIPIKIGSTDYKLKIFEWICQHDVRLRCDLTNLFEKFEEKCGGLEFQVQLKILKALQCVQFQLSKFYDNILQPLLKIERDSIVIGDNFMKGLSFIDSDIMHWEISDGNLMDKVECGCILGRARDLHLETCARYRHAMDEYMINVIRNNKHFEPEKKGLFELIDTKKPLAIDLLNACKVRIEDLVKSAIEFYDTTSSELIDDQKSYKDLTKTQKREFHELITDIHCQNMSGCMKDVNEMRNMLRLNVNKLGVNFYSRLLIKLAMIGWYGHEGFLNELQCISESETVWTIDAEQLTTMKCLVLKIFTSSMRNDRKEILNNLKEMAKYIPVSKYGELMRTFYDDEINSDLFVYKAFYNKLQTVATLIEQKYGHKLVPLASHKSMKKINSK